MNEVIIVGGGLAGSEASYLLAKRGIKVTLFEMRPQKMTPAHKSGNLAELVCSNSFRSNDIRKAAGLLKEEMRLLSSLTMEVAEEAKVPAGMALAVDREIFSRRITEIFSSHPLIKIVREEVREVPQERPVIIATGPLTSPSLEKSLRELTGAESLYFYDAAAPIVLKESIDMEKAFEGNRYGKGEGSYINCPLTEEEYEIFYNELVKAERILPRDFEREIYFTACQPVESLARQGKQTLLFGPMKPVGLVDPRTGKQPYAVVQLRQDDAAAQLYNMVGFQTSLKWKEQERVFKLIPALRNAEFVRFGVMHRNTYLNSPEILKPTLEMRDFPGIFLAGQISGVEGYIESAASGIVAALNVYAKLRGFKEVILPPTTALGSLLLYISNENIENFQPMHVNFGLLPPLGKKMRKRERYEAYAKRAISDLKAFLAQREELL
jgi:methylenetetrahydrofolate--tRNA-(uracil-5-)-methyltransferase